VKKILTALALTALLSTSCKSRTFGASEVANLAGQTGATDFELASDPNPDALDDYETNAAVSGMDFELRSDSRPDLDFN
jgi:hypothetical protein